jgi:sarcosine oxidase subunit beta
MSPDRLHQPRVGISHNRVVFSRLVVVSDASVERAEVLIAGGGIIGTGVAWALAQRGVRGIAVVDLDLAGIYASSELNAGGARATWWQPVNIETCAATLAFFREHREAFDFSECGYLWLYDDANRFARANEMIPRQNAHGLDVVSLTVADVAERFPVLDRSLDELVGATHSPRDGLINPNAVRRFYRQQAEALGVRFLDRHYVSGVATRAGATGLRSVSGVDVVEVAPGGATDDEGVLLDILTRHRVPSSRALAETHVACDVVVNCLGAWSPIFSAKIGVSDVTEPVRRQIALVDVHREDVADGVDLTGAGMIVDASNLYFHPDGPYVLAGYSTPEEPPGFDFSYDGNEFFEREVWPRLAHRASSFERCGHVRGWAGLYAVTPDCSGIAGAVAGFSNLFEAHSFTGRGVMQSYGIATALAESIDGAGRSQIDITPLSRDRFTSPDRWVSEDLHI